MNALKRRFEREYGRAPNDQEYQGAMALNRISTTSIRGSESEGIRLLEKAVNRVCKMFAETELSLEERDAGNVPGDGSSSSSSLVELEVGAHLN